VKKLVAVNERGLRIGEDHPNAKLSNAQVDELFDLVDAGKTSREIASLLGVSHDLVKKIRCGHRRCQWPASWKLIEVQVESAGKGGE
jgi:hypothetical protein